MSRLASIYSLKTTTEDPARQCGLRLEHATPTNGKWKTSGPARLLEDNEGVWVQMPPNIVVLTSAVSKQKAQMRPLTAETAPIGSRGPGTQVVGDLVKNGE